jgi:dATP pyrophosphohydrolase
MTRRPDLVDVLPFRLTSGRPEALLLRRASGDEVLPGLWQGVSGLIEASETIVEAARRELLEETGFGEGAIQAFYHLDYTAEFLWEPLDALMTSAYFAALTRPGIDPVLSDEHDAFRWVSLEEAITDATWPGYREGFARIRDNLLDPDRARWFLLQVAADGG